MEVERKLLDDESTPVPGKLLVRFPEKSVLVFEAIDWLYDKQKKPISKITLNEICKARGYLETGTRGAKKGSKDDLGEMFAAWVEVRGIDKRNDPNENNIPVDMGEDEEAQLLASKIRQSLNKKYQAQYAESLEKAESIAEALNTQLYDMRKALAEQEKENEALRRKLHEMEPVYQDALAQHGKMRAQNETLQVALDKALASYDHLAETLKAEFGQQALAIIEAKDGQIADLQQQVETLKREVKATRNSLMDINEEQRGVFIVDKDHAKTKIADLEERLRDATEIRMELHRKNTRLSNEKAALELELKNLQELGGVG